ncbi:MAG: hypothetical protein M3540_12295 [Actinomycetota bacterium]|nr:hypothetical protein [Actinomycetota bacterium]
MSASGPCPYRERAYEPIWNSPRYWPFRAQTNRCDSHRATLIACEQYGPNTRQITAAVLARARRQWVSIPRQNLSVSSRLA